VTLLVDTLRLSGDVLLSNITLIFALLFVWCSQCHPY